MQHHKLESVVRSGPVRFGLRTREFKNTFKKNAFAVADHKPVNDDVANIFNQPASHPSIHSSIYVSIYLFIHSISTSKLFQQAYYSLLNDLFVKFLFELFYFTGLSRLEENCSTDSTNNKVVKLKV